MIIDVSKYNISLKFSLSFNEACEYYDSIPNIDDVTIVTNGTSMRSFSKNGNILHRTNGPAKFFILVIMLAQHTIILMA